MPLNPVTLGYVPLIDAAPLIVARELGFAAEEGLELRLERLGAWAQARDTLGAGLIDAAHMLVPMPVAQALGLGPALPELDLVMFLSQGGQAVAINQDLAMRMRARGYGFDFRDARKAGAALCDAVQGRLRIGVPFLFSTQFELMRHWLDGCGFRHRLEVVTVPPHRMAEAVAVGEVDAFCVGEPWASDAVERGVASLLLPGVAIWASPPEKGLVMRREFTQAQPQITGALMRTLWRAGRWLDVIENRRTAAEILSRREYLDLSPELVERGLTGVLQISPRGTIREVPGFVAFHAGAANFPWRSIAALLAARIAERHGLNPAAAMDKAMAHFRTDLYRRHLRQAGAALPGASARVEGMLVQDREVGAEKGQMILRADAFFDGATFDPSFAD